MEPRLFWWVIYPDGKRVPGARSETIDGALELAGAKLSMTVAELKRRGFDVEPEVTDPDEGDE